MDFVSAIETAVGRTAKKNYLPMQAGDVPATWADTSLLAELTGNQPQTPVADGIKKFVDWYTEYYQKA
jgi:UDP-glucuronate 4-epimerase